jgi:hypothetical protein
LATVDHLEEFHKRFTVSQLEDELFVQAGRSVMSGTTYQRRRPNGQA